MNLPFRHICSVKVVTLSRFVNAFLLRCGDRKLLVGQMKENGNFVINVR